MQLQITNICSDRIGSSTSSVKHISKTHIQLTLVISNSKGLSEILRDIRTSTYQICGIEEKIIRTTTFVCVVCVEVLRPSQPNGVMSSAVSLPNHTFTGQA